MTTNFIVHHLLLIPVGITDWKVIIDDSLRNQVNIMLYYVYNHSTNTIKCHLFLISCVSAFGHNRYVCIQYILGNSGWLYLRNKVCRYITSLAETICLHIIPHQFNNVMCIVVFTSVNTGFDAIQDKLLYIYCYSYEYNITIISWIGHVNRLIAKAYIVMKLYIPNNTINNSTIVWKTKNLP